MNSLATRSSFEKRSRATSTHCAGCCSPNCILAIRVIPQTSPDVLAKALESELRFLLVLTLDQNVVGMAICSSSRTWTSMTIIENVVAGATRSTGTTGSNRFARVIIAEAPLLHEFENIGGCCSRPRRERCGDACAQAAGSRHPHAARRPVPARHGQQLLRADPRARARRARQLRQSPRRRRPLGAPARPAGPSSPRRPRAHDRRLHHRPSRARASHPSRPWLLLAPLGLLFTAGAGLAGAAFIAYHQDDLYSLLMSISFLAALFTYGALLYLSR